MIDDIRTVSYTHLDVYKRQIDDIQRSCILSYSSKHIFFRLFILAVNLGNSVVNLAIVARCTTSA